jgi:hypothetical protein
MSGYCIFIPASAAFGAKKTPWGLIVAAKASSDFSLYIFLIAFCRTGYELKLLH